MNVNVIEKPVTPLKFPCLMVSESRTVVLFYEENKGTIVIPDIIDPTHFDRLYPMAQYRDDWNMTHFKRFNGKLVLQNDENDTYS